jgi:hypothetical protein
MDERRGIESALVVTADEVLGGTIRLVATGVNANAVPRDAPVTN